MMVLSWAHGMPSPVDQKRIARRETRVVAGQERDSLGDFFDRARPAQRVRVLGLVQELRVVFLAHALPGQQVGDHHSGVDAVHPDAFRRQFQRHASGELVHGRLRHAVRQHVRKRPHAVHAGHVDYVTPGLDQMRHGQHGQMVHGPHVRVHHPVVLVQRRGLDGPVLQDARVVHQHVQPTVVGDGRVQHVRGVVLVGQVAGDHERPQRAALLALVGHGPQVDGVAAGERQFRAQPREVHRGRRADPRTGAGDQHYFAVETHTFFFYENDNYESHSKLRF